MAKLTARIAEIGTPGVSVRRSVGWSVVTSGAILLGAHAIVAMRNML